MNILVLNGSPRPNGSTAAMIQAFKEGAKNHNITVVNVCQKKIAGCLACEYCHTKGNGTCIQKDDMQEVYALLKEAEMLVLASPIYYHGISGQLKCTIDPYPEKWTLRRSVESKHIYKSQSARIKKQTNYQVRENSANKTKRNPLFKQKHKLRTQEKDKM